MPFADFQALYKQKLTTADEAVKIIKSGDWVDYGFCAIHPRVLDEALARRAPELEDVKVRGGISLWKPAIFDVEDPVHHIIFNSHHMSSVERHHIASGAGFHEPMRYSELPRYYYDHITPPDVAMFQVTPMDKHGYFNFGLSASHVKAVCEMAKVVIVEVNENMPRFDAHLHGNARCDGFVIGRAKSDELIVNLLANGAFRLSGRALPHALRRCLACHAHRNSQRGSSKHANRHGSVSRALERGLQK